MAFTLQDLLAALGGTLNGITQSVMSMTFGFAMLPSAFAYLVGIIGCLAFNSTVPISFQAETMAMAGCMGKTRSERLSMVLIAGLAMTALGSFGLLEDIIAFAGENVTAAMMAGVGVILAKISIDMVRSDRKIGSISLAIGIITYFLTKSLVYTCIASILVSTLIAVFFKLDSTVSSTIEDEIKFQKPIINLIVIRGVLALMCITIGGNIAFGRISAGISGTTANVDHITIYSGLADAVSSIFGGSPISVVISPTAAAPNPKASAVLMMAIMMVILLSKQLPKIAKHIPASSVAGTLFILGAALTIPPNLQAAFANSRLPAVPHLR